MKKSKLAFILLLILLLCSRTFAEEDRKPIANVKTTSLKNLVEYFTENGLDGECGISIWGPSGAIGCMKYDTDYCKLYIIQYENKVAAENMDLIDECYANGYFVIYFDSCSEENKKAIINLFNGF